MKSPRPEDDRQPACVPTDIFVPAARLEPMRKRYAVRSETTRANHSTISDAKRESNRNTRDDIKYKTTQVEIQDDSSFEVYIDDFQTEPLSSRTGRTSPLYAASFTSCGQA